MCFVSFQIVSELLVFVCTVISLILAIWPFLNLEPLSNRQTVIFTWVDLFITYIFLLDLMVRYTIRYYTEKIFIRFYSFLYLLIYIYMYVFFQK